MPRCIVVTEYSPAWRAGFEKGAALIKEVLGENCIALYHIGSTAVPGLKAKPIISMMSVVSELSAVDAAAAEFGKLGETVDKSCQPKVSEG